MIKFTVTGYIQIPVEIEVDADTVEEAFDKGIEDLGNGLGYQGDPYMNDDYYLATATDYVPVAQQVDGMRTVEPGWQ